MGGIVEGPVPADFFRCAPSDVKVHLVRDLAAHLADVLPFIVRHFPMELRMDDIDRAALAVRGVGPDGFRPPGISEGLLFLFRAKGTMDVERDTPLSRQLDQLGREKHHLRFDLLPIRFVVLAEYMFRSEQGGRAKALRDVIEGRLGSFGGRPTERRFFALKGAFFGQYGLIHRLG